MIEWNKELLQPIHDEQGVEQGGIKSLEFYKIYNNEQLEVAQKSSFGVDIGSINVAAIGQADDVVLVSSDLNCLSNLLSLTMSAVFFIMWSSHMRRLNSNFSLRQNSSNPFSTGLLHHQFLYTITSLISLIQQNMLVF